MLLLQYVPSPGVCIEAFNAKVHCYVAESSTGSGIVKIALLIHKQKYSNLHLTLSWTAAKLLKLSFCTSAGRLEPFFRLDIQKMIKLGSLTEEQL